MWCLLLPALAEASTLGRVPALSELQSRSQAVVVAVVTDVITEPAPYGLATVYTLDVLQTLAGATTGQTTLRLPGGRDGDLQQTFSDVPNWKVGDTVVVFLPRAGERQSAAGLFTLDGDLVVDPLERSGGPRTLADLEQELAPRAQPAPSPSPSP